MPVVLSRVEVKGVLNNLTGIPYLAAALMYGSGLRLMECLRLRVKDIDFSHNQIMVRSGKGDKEAQIFRSTADQWLAPRFAGSSFLLRLVLGFRSAPPQALCCCLLRRLLHGSGLKRRSSKPRAPSRRLKESGRS